MKLTRAVFSVFCIIMIVTFLLACVSIFKIDRIETEVANNHFSLTDLKRKVIDINNGLRVLSGNIEVYSDNIKEILETDTGDVAVGSESEICLVRECGGVVGVYDTEGELIYTENIAVSSLSAYDRERLEVGIIACSSEELGNIIASLK